MQTTPARIRLVATHTAKVVSPYARSAVPLALGSEQVEGVIGIHSLPVEARLFRSGNAAENVVATQWIEAGKEQPRKIAEHSMSVSDIRGLIETERAAEVGKKSPKEATMEEKKRQAARSDACAKLNPEKGSGRDDAVISCYLQKAAKLGAFSEYADAIEYLFRMHNKAAIDAIGAATEGACLSAGEDSIDTGVRQVLIPTRDGSEDIAITPLTAPSVLGAVIVAIKEARFDKENPRRIPVTKHFAYVSDKAAGNAAPSHMLRGLIFHAVPPVRDAEYATAIRLHLNPEGWLESTLFRMRRHPQFVAAWDALVRHLKEAGDRPSLPSWMQHRGVALRNRIVKPIAYEVRCIDEEASDGQIAEVIAALVSTIEKEVGVLHEKTKNWFEEGAL